ncbi:glycosyltransferase family 2 protein [Kineococcus sp. SYSU DK006]|uniref:glycosyltransferase family 2 protein n=1 Tax=Kineococcus sp. SYSU DK006 TaxID=3383127 RepID=UPI003D7E44B3
MAGKPTFISGCYIVKDEEEFIGASLTAIAAFVDEVVVYDTGSTDRTRDIAREHGARVIEGYWDDDFGGARNRALEHCRGEWVLNVDADEVAVGDPRAWRRSLHLAEHDVFTVEISSTQWGDAGNEVRCPVNRVMRRAACRWEGAIHEQIVGRWAEVRRAHNEAVWLKHYGYSEVMFRERDKGARNMTLAEKALRTAREKGQDTAEAIVQLGRSASVAGQHRKALDVFADLDMNTVPPGLGMLAAISAVQCALAVADLDAAETWIGRMRTWGQDEQVCRSFEGKLAMARLDFAGAEAIFSALEPGRSSNGMPFDPDNCGDELVICIARQGRRAEAAERLLQRLRAGKLGLPPIDVVGYLDGIEDGPQRLAEALPEALAVPYVGHVQVCEASFASTFLAALWEADRARLAIVAAVGKLARRLPVPLVLEWALRLREAQLAEHCPLRRILTDTGRDSLSRILCGAALYEIGEEDVLARLEPLLASVPDEEAGAVLTAVRDLAPRFAALLVPA